MLTIFAPSLPSLPKMSMYMYMILQQPHSFEILWSVWSGGGHQLQPRKPSTHEKRLDHCICNDSVSLSRRSEVVCEEDRGGDGGMAGTDSNSVKTEFCLFDLTVGMQGRF